MQDGNYIEKPVYESKTKRLYINKIQYFNDVPQNLWDFEIGGYKVLYRWLNERKGRNLSYGEQIQIKKIIFVLDETLKIMKEIDKVYNV